MNNTPRRRINRTGWWVELTRDSDDPLVDLFMIVVGAVFLAIFLATGLWVMAGAP